MHTSTGKRHEYKLKNKPLCGEQLHANNRGYKEIGNPLHETEHITMAITTAVYKRKENETKIMELQSTLQLNLDKILKGYMSFISSFSSARTMSIIPIICRARQCMSQIRKSHRIFQKRKEKTRNVQEFVKVYSIVVNRLGMFRGISNDGQFFLV